MNNPFKALHNHPALPAGYPVGSWVMSASPLVAEAIAGTPMLPITRIPWNDTVMVKRVLDAGAQTLMFPFVQNAEEARRAVAAAKYAPEGVRGMAAMSRGSRFGTVKEYFKVANAAVSVIVQVETPEAMERIEEIASVPGVDSIFMGPGDLSGAMGHVGDLMHPAVVALMADGVQRCHKVGKPVGTVGGTPEAVATYRAAGFDYIGCASDLGLLMRNCSAALSAIRSQDLQVQALGY
jgi:2-keto-3-deoxy-L-rhamnonate aldolase RhmA